MNEPRNLRDDAIAIWQSGVEAVNARRLVRDFVSVTEQTIGLGDCQFARQQINRIVVVGFGKASGAMALGLEQALGEAVLDSHSVEGLINVPDDQVVKTSTIRVVGCRPPGENLPTQRVLAGTREILELVRSAGPRDVCICLISGGGSALLEQPTSPITLDEFRHATKMLSGCGASIYELNAVRRSISDVKGGGLAALSGGAPLVSLIVSDVVGDQLDVIASGPTVPSKGGINAIDVLREFDPDRSRIPESVWGVVESSITPSVGLTENSRVSNFVIGNIETAIRAAQEKAVELGYAVAPMLVSGNEGDAGETGASVLHQAARMIQTGGMHCQIAGGETTVSLNDNPGEGGRNQHLILSALAQQLEHSIVDDGEFCILSGGTDGEDGTVPVAGAWVDSELIRRLSLHEDPSLIATIATRLNSALQRFDSYPVLSELGCVLCVPPTSTNVCDLRIVLTRSRARESVGG